MLLLGLQYTMKNYLQQNISKLFPHHFRAFKINRFHDLINLFEEILLDSLMSLHLIPRAAVLTSEYLHDLNQIIYIIALLRKQLSVLVFQKTIPFKQSANEHIIYFEQLPLIIITYFTQNFKPFIAFF